jgi:hypothetical protein
VGGPESGVDIGMDGPGRIGCDSVDFNRDGVFASDADILDFFSVLAGGPCPYAGPCDVDFNNNCVFPEDDDVLLFFDRLAGGDC